jgi:uncharacterized protein
MLELLARDKMKGAPMVAAPINSEWIEAGNPQASIAILAYSDDRASTTILWECTAGKFTWHYSIDETIYFLDGGVSISIDGKPAKHYGAGDTIHFSRGAVATWEVETFIRKVAFCRSVMPRPLVELRRFARSLYLRLRGRSDALNPAAALG